MQRAKKRLKKMYNKRNIDITYPWIEEKTHLALFSSLAENPLWALYTHVQYVKCRMSEILPALTHWKERKGRMYKDRKGELYFFFGCVSRN